MYKPVNPKSMAKLHLKSSALMLGLGLTLLGTDAFAVPEFTTESVKLIDTIKGPIAKTVIIAGGVMSVAIGIFKQTWWPLVTAGGLGITSKMLMEWIQVAFP
jgi:hypothetical protein